MLRVHYFQADINTAPAGALSHARSQGYGNARPVPGSFPLLHTPSFDAPGNSTRTGHQRELDREEPRKPKPFCPVASNGNILRRQDEWLLASLVRGLGVSTSTLWKMADSAGLPVWRRCLGT